MKLTGSRQERIMLDELISSNLELNNGDLSCLANALDAANVNIKSAYIFDYIPEQYEDIYYVLISNNHFIIAEVPRGGGEVLLSIEKIAEYKSKFSKVHKRKLALALQLRTSTVSAFEN